MVIAEIAEGLTGIKTALDILKGLKKSGASGAILAEIADLQTALIEVQQGIMAANQTHTADIEAIRDLEAEVACLKAWDGEKARYELKSISGVAFVYSLKASESNGEPPHWLCANCYGNRKKSLLQVQGMAERDKVWKCPECDSKVLTGYLRGPDKPDA